MSTEISVEELAEMAAEIVNLVGQRWKGRTAMATAGLVVLQLAVLIVLDTNNFPGDLQLEAAKAAMALMKRIQVHDMKKAAKA